MKKVLVLAALLLIFMPVVAADFTVSASTAEQTVCATDTILYVITVQSAGGSADSYTASLSGDAAKWAVAAPAGFVLNSDSKDYVYVYVTPSSGALPGAYDLKVKINGQETLLKVNVGDCHSASLAAESLSGEVCADTSAEYTLTLTNTGKYTETFDLSLSGTAANWATLSDTVAKLTVGATKQIKVTAIPPADQTGLFDLTVTAKAENSNAAADLALSLKSDNCYEFGLTPDKNYFSFCENSEVKIPLTIENKGNVDNVYSLSAAGPAWISLEQQSLAVPAKGARTTNLVLFPDYGVAGDFAVAVKAASDKGMQNSEQAITANVQTCYLSDLKLSAEDDTICPFTSKAYEVSLKNTGTFDERYAITLTGADFATLDKSFADIKAGGIENLNLLVDAKDVPAGTYMISVKAEAQDPAHAKSSDVLTLKIAPKESCFGVQTTAALTKVQAAPGEGTLVPVVVENKGSEESTYNLEVSGTGAAYAKLNPAVVTIEGRRAKTVYLYIAVPEETARREYLLTVSARLEDGTVSSSSAVVLDVVGPIKPAAVTSVVPTAQERVSSALQPLKDRVIALRDAVSAWFAKIKMPGVTVPQVNITPPEEIPPEVIPQEEIPQEEVNLTEEELPPAQVPEEIIPIGTATEISQFLSPEAQKKFLESQGIEVTPDMKIENITITIQPRQRTPIETLRYWKNKLSGAGTAVPAEEPTQRIKDNVKKILNFNALTSGAYGQTKTFLAERTYGIGNWLWLAGIIIVLAAVSYMLRGDENKPAGNGKNKGAWQKFMDWLEEEDEPVKEEQKPAISEPPKPKAQDILNEVAKEQKEQAEKKVPKPAPRKRRVARKK